MITVEVGSRESELWWLHVEQPDAADYVRMRDEFGVHPLVLEDIAEDAQRSKVDYYGDQLALVVHRLRPGTVTATEEVHAVALGNVVLTVTDGASRIVAEIHERLEAVATTLPQNPASLFYCLLDAVVDDNVLAADELAAELELLEDGVLAQGMPATQRIYRAVQCTLAVQRTVEPIASVVEQVLHSKIAPKGELRSHFRDVDDHAQRTVTRVSTDRSRLESLIQLNATLIAQTQNDQTKKISAWGAIFFAPTLVAGIYGMNFRNMPELHWFFGYPFALLLMVTFVAILWLLFKRNSWL